MLLSWMRSIDTYIRKSICGGYDMCLRDACLDFIRIFKFFMKIKFGYCNFKNLNFNIFSVFKEIIILKKFKKFKKFLKNIKN